MAFLKARISQHQPDDISSGFILRDEGGYYTLESKGSTSLQLSKRAAYPVTYAHQTQGGAFVCGYGQYDPSPNDEFLQIIINPQGHVRIQRDAFATLPLFYACTPDELIISNDYGYVFSALPSKTLNLRGVLSSLLPNTADRDSLWSEISVLGERQVLEWFEGKMVVHQPKARGWSSSPQAEESDPADFKRILDGHFSSILENVVTRNSLGFEASGGLDSATLPLYCAPFLKYSDVPIFSIVYPGDFGTSQLEKLESLASTTGLELHTVFADPATMYPLARMIQGRAPYVHTSTEEIYTEPIARMVQEMAARHISVVGTGLGGDDIFENRLSSEQQLAYGHVERRRRRMLHYPEFYTAAFRAAYIESTLEVPSYPLPLLPVSLSGQPNTHNNIYIERGIWPVSAYADPELYRFCQGLPAHFRANKNILRAYHSAYGFPEAIYNPRQNEHFGPFFIESLSSGRYDDIIYSLASNALTAELGYVDLDMMLVTYEQCKANLADKMQLYYVFLWIGTEINLQIGTGRFKYSA